MCLNTPNRLKIVHRLKIAVNAVKLIVSLLFLMFKFYYLKCPCICYPLLVRADSDLDYIHYRQITFTICHIMYNTEDCNDQIWIIMSCRL